jgi:hypothetical protein
VYRAAGVLAQPDEISGNIVVQPREPATYIQVGWDAQLLSLQHVDDAIIITLMQAVYGIACTN